LIPYSIFRSITSDPISIAAIPTRSLVVHTRARLRLTSRVEPLCGTSANDHTHAPSSERDDIARSGSKISIRIPGSFRAHRQHVPDLELLEPGHDLRGAVHFQSEQTLDPVICVRAATTNAHLHEPRPDRRGRDVDRDRPRTPSECVGSSRE
jgi:hypothetical protein